MDLTYGCAVPTTYSNWELHSSIWRQNTDKLNTTSVNKFELLFMISRYYLFLSVMQENNKICILKIVITYSGHVGLHDNQTIFIGI